jgi:peptide/nickel transport system permease protein
VSVLAAGATPEPEVVNARQPALAVIRLAFGLWRMRIGVAIATTLSLVALIGPYFAPHGPTAFFGVLPNTGPSSKALFGTDYLGQDVLSRFLWGGREILVMAASASSPAP